MKIYKLQLSVTLIEQPEKPEELPDAELEDAPSVDPVKRTDRFNDRLLGMMEKISKGNLPMPGAYPPPSSANLNVSRTFDLPAESFEEATQRVDEIMAVARKVGTPSDAGLFYRAYPVG